MRPVCAHHLMLSFSYWSFLCSDKSSRLQQLTASVGYTLASHRQFIVWTIGHNIRLISCSISGHMDFSHALFLHQLLRKIVGSPDAKLSTMLFLFHTCFWASSLQGGFTALLTEKTITRKPKQHGQNLPKTVRRDEITRDTSAHKLSCEPFF